MEPNANEAASFDLGLPLPLMDSRLKVKMGHQNDFFIRVKLSPVKA